MRRHGGHRRGPPGGWWWIRSIHRQVVWSVVSAFLLGAAAGYALHLAQTTGDPRAWVGVGVLCLLLLPASFSAVLRIARPMRELARFATALREGQLDRPRPASGEGEVAEVSQALGGLADRVQRQLDDQRALLAAVSHELRSPLGRLRVQTELLRDGLTSGAAFDDVQREIDGMDALVADLLAAARIDFDAVRPTDLDAADAGLRALERADLSPALLDARPASIRADPTLLGRALGVLVDNGRRYGGQVVRLGVVPDATSVRFEVDDDGPGFADGEEVMAFQPFWRRPGETSAGTGLGLALVRQIAAAHQGEAGAVNLPGGGARVWLDLPLTPPR